MKKIFVVAAFLCGFFVASAQCGDDLMKQALKDMGTFQYIKDFDINVAGAEGVKFSVVLNSRTHYQLNLANGEGNGEQIVVQLFDGEKMLGTNSASGKTYKAFQFVCSKTGAYKLHFFCPNGSKGCARAVLSLVKQYSESEMP